MCCVAVANRAFLQFDKSMMDALSNQVKNKTQMKVSGVLSDWLIGCYKSPSNTPIQGHLHTYRLCDEVWTFIVKNPQMKVDQGELLTSDKIKIVACRNTEGNPFQQPTNQPANSAGSK